MNLTSYHSHALYCDGRAGAEDLVRFAISQGLISYSISSHALLLFPTHRTMEWDHMDDYLAELARMKKGYAPEIELTIGLEIDYLNENSSPAVPYFRELPFDYRIGSIRLLYNDREGVADIDMRVEVFRNIVDQHSGDDLDRVVRLYYKRLLQMVEPEGFDISGCADKICHSIACYRPGLPDEPWYNDLTHDYFSAVAARGYIVEVNARALRHLGTFFPNERYFPLLEELGVHM